MEMPEGWKRAKYDIGNVTPLGQELSYALDLMKEMAEALEEIERWAPKDLYANPPWAVLKKFGKWK